MKKLVFLASIFAFSYVVQAQKNDKKGGTQPKPPQTNVPPKMQNDPNGGPKNPKDKPNKGFPNVEDASNNLKNISSTGPFFKLRDSFKKVEEEIKLSTDSLLEMAFPNQVDNFTSIPNANMRSMKMGQGNVGPQGQNGLGGPPQGPGAPPMGGGGTSGPAGGPPMMGGGMLGGSLMGGQIFTKLYSDNSLNKNPDPTVKNKQRGSIRLSISEQPMEIARYKGMVDNFVANPNEQMVNELVDVKGNKGILTSFKNAPRHEMVFVKNGYLIKIEGNNLESTDVLKKLANQIIFEMVISTLGQ